MLTKMGLTLTGNPICFANTINNSRMKFKRIPKDLITITNMLRLQGRSVSYLEVRPEFEKILMSRKPSTGIRLLQEWGLLKLILPEVAILDAVPQNSPWHHLNVFDHTLEVLDRVPPKLNLRWVALLHDTGKKDARTTDETGRDRFSGHDKISAQIAARVLNRFGIGEKLSKNITKLILLHQAEPETFRRTRMKQFLRVLGADNLEDWKRLRKADIYAHHPDSIEHGMSIHRERVAVIDDIVTSKEPFDYKHLAVDDTDMEKIGFSSPLALRQAQKEVLDMVTASPRKNDRESLLAWLEANKKRIEKEARKYELE